MMAHIPVNVPIIFTCEVRHICVTWFIENCTSNLVYIYHGCMKRWMDEWFSEMEVTDGAYKSAVSCSHSVFVSSVSCVNDCRYQTANL